MKPCALFEFKFPSEIHVFSSGIRYASTRLWWGSRRSWCSTQHARRARRARCARSTTRSTRPAGTLFLSRALARCVSVSVSVSLTLLLCFFFLSHFALILTVLFCIQKKYQSVYPYPSSLSRPNCGSECCWAGMRSFPDDPFIFRLFLYFSCMCAHDL